jgi:iron complex transport system ATP-binding protein
MKDALNVKNLKIGYKNHKTEIPIGPEINFSIKNGELAMLIGQNGIGKSTLLKTLCKLIPNISGHITINSTNIEEISIKQLASQIAFVSTANNIPFRISIFDMVALGRSPYLNWIGRLDKKDIEIVNSAIEDMELTKLKDKSFLEVSDGERQKALIARALSQNTPVIILDEPTAYLDLLNKYNIIHRLANIAHEQGKAILLSTHDLNIALAEADKMLIMFPDKFVEGAPEDLQLKNYINEIFKNKLNIDPVTGVIKKNKTPKASVRIIGEKINRTVFHLTQNAMERIEIMPVKEDENAEILVKIEKTDSEYRWLIERINTSIPCKNIYELCLELKKIINSEIF